MLKQLILTASVLAFTSSVFAGPHLKALLAQQHRPSIAQVKEAFVKDGEKSNPYAQQSALHGHNNEWAQLLAKMIAQFEAAYPGAVYAPLGRDMVGLGDMLDAFYLSRGEQGRVLRLNASGNTIRSISDDERVQFLRAAGIDREGLLSGKTFVVFDSTYYKESSQSKGLLNAVFRNHVANGGKASELVERLAFVNAYESPDAGIRIEPGFDRKMLLARAKKSADETGAAPEEHFALPVRPTNRYHVYTAEWHDTFGKLQPDFKALPGQQHEHQKTSVLGEMIDIILQMEAPSFHQLVESEAQKLKVVLKPAVRSCLATLKGS